MSAVYTAADVVSGALSAWGGPEFAAALALSGLPLPARGHDVSAEARVALVVRAVNQVNLAEVRIHAGRIRAVEAGRILPDDQAGDLAGLWRDTRHRRLCQELADAVGLARLAVTMRATAAAHRARTRRAHAA